MVEGHVLLCPYFWEIPGLAIEIQMNIDINFDIIEISCWISVLISILSKFRFWNRFEIQVRYLFWYNRNFFLNIDINFDIIEIQLLNIDINFGVQKITENDILLQCRYSNIPTLRDTNLLMISW